MGAIIREIEKKREDTRIFILVHNSSLSCYVQYQTARFGFDLSLLRIGYKVPKRLYEATSPIPPPITPCERFSSRLHYITNLPAR